MDLISPPFGIGLAAGLAFAVVAVVHGALSRRPLLREIRALRDHLQRHVEITAVGQRTLTTDLEGLRRENENLRVSNATLSQKPGRAELRTLLAYDRAVRLMQARAPGFAPAWENALHEAERELADADRGLLPLLRRAFRPALPRGVVPAPPAGGGGEGPGEPGRGSP